MSTPQQQQQQMQHAPAPSISYDDAIQTLQSMFPERGWSAAALGKREGEEGGREERRMGGA
jgi:hypothetical protein